MDLSDPLLRRLTDALPTGVAYVDRDGRCRFVNRTLCEHLGVTPDALVDRPVAGLPCGVAKPRVQHHVELALAGRPQTFECEELVRGEPRIFECRLVPDADESGRAAGFFFTRLDITERVRAARSLEREGAILQSVMEAVPAIIMVVDRQLRFRFVNGAFERWRETPRSRIVGRSMEEVLGDDEYLRMRAGAHCALAGGTVQFERNYPGRGRATHLSFTFMALHLPDNRVDGFVGVAHDVTAQRLEHVRLARLAQRDALTGLLNRAGFEERVEQILRSRDGAPVALLYIDLDGFKAVNDLHGHPTGDQLLRLVADRFGHLVRPTDAVARLGGDEFAVMLGGVRERAHALGVAEKILAAAATPFDIGGSSVRIGASVGLAWGHGHAQELATRAYAALYEAKREGKGTVRYAPDAPARSLTARDASVHAVDVVSQPVAQVSRTRSGCR